MSPAIDGLYDSGRPSSDEDPLINDLNDLHYFTLKIAEMDWLLSKVEGNSNKHREVAGTLPGRGMVLLKGVRCLYDQHRESENSDYENDSEDQQTKEKDMEPHFTGIQRTSSSPNMDVSLALSEESNQTVTDLPRGASFDLDNSSNMDAISMGTVGTGTLRRRRSFQPKRNYRICDPDESQYWLQLQAYGENATNSLRANKGAKLLRRWSTKEKQKEGSFSPSPRPGSFLSPPHAEMDCPPGNPNNNQFMQTCGPDSRLSFVSSSTGYSSARSSLRSSDGADDDPNSEILFSPSTSLSEARRRALVANGGLTRMQRIASELIETERIYCNDLWQVIQGYLNYLVDCRDSLELTVDEVSGTFGCIERLFQINRRLYTELDSTELNYVQICKCFIENSGRFDDYVIYCNNYQKMLNTLSRISLRPRVAEALSRRQSMLGHALPLNSYLLKPVQRILKYHLFIENMLEELEIVGGPDFLEEEKIMKKALGSMTAQASRINDEKKRSEHQERVTQLHSQISRWKNKQSTDLSAYGELLLEASFRMHGSKTNRLLFLFEEMLLIAKQRGDSYECKDYINCSNMMLNELVTDDPLAFQVLSFDNPKAQYIFLANNTDQKRIWVQELKRMVLDHYEVAIPEETKRLMLSMDHTQPRVSFGRPEFAEVALKHHKKVPKYLEKRRKSVDRRERDDSPRRRRSLSASRIVMSEPVIDSPDPVDRPLKMFGDDVTIQEQSFDIRSEVKNPAIEKNQMIKCQCPDEPGTSQSNSEPRFQSQMNEQTCVGKSTKRLYEGKKYRHPPPIPKHDMDSCASHNQMFCSCQKKKPPKPSHYNPKKIANSDIEQTFADLYRSLTMLGTDNVGLASHKEHPVSPADTAAASRRLDHLVRRYTADPEPVRLRSKSLTRLDDLDRNFFVMDDDNMGYILPQVKKQRSAAHEQTIREKMQKYGDLDLLMPAPPPPHSFALPTISVHNGLAQSEFHIARPQAPTPLKTRTLCRPMTSIDSCLLSPEVSADSPIRVRAGSDRPDGLEKWQQKREQQMGGAPPVPDRWSNPVSTDNRRLSGSRQRTALTADQIRQLDDVLMEPNLGVVKEMVRQFEHPPAEIPIATQHPKSTLFI